MKDRGALCFTPVALVSKVALPNAIARREAIARPFGRSQSRQDSKFRFGSNGPHGFGRLTRGVGSSGCQGECAGRREAHFRARPVGPTAPGHHFPAKGSLARDKASIDGAHGRALPESSRLCSVRHRKGGRHQVARACFGYTKGTLLLRPSIAKRAVGGASE